MKPDDDFDHLLREIEDRMERSYEDAGELLRKSERLLAEAERLENEFLIESATWRRLPKWG
jgi:hypothetical protein